MSKLQEKSLPQLLDLLANGRAISQENIDAIKSFINENFEETPRLKLMRAHKEIDAMTLPDEVKEAVKLAQSDACDLASRLDPLHIISFQQFETLVQDFFKIKQGLHTRSPLKWGGG